MLRMLQRMKGRDMETIHTASDPGTGLSVTVSADWPAGRFTVTFRDDDAGAIIETRVYSNPDSALWFARRVLGGTA